MPNRILPLCLSLSLFAAARADVASPPPPPTEGKALAYALIGTAAPLAGTGLCLLTQRDNEVLLLSGILAGTGAFLFAPSAGQWYAQSPGPGWIGTGIRAIGAAVLLIGFADWIHEDLCGFDEDGRPNSEKSVCSDHDSAIKLGIGGAILAAGAAYSIIDARPAVRRYRKRLAPRIGFSPAVFPAPDGAWTAAGRAWLRF